MHAMRCTPTSASDAALPGSVKLLLPGAAAAAAMTGGLVPYTAARLVLRVLLQIAEAPLLLLLPLRGIGAWCRCGEAGHKAAAGANRSVPPGASVVRIAVCIVGFPRAIILPSCARGEEWTFDVAALEKWWERSLLPQ